MLSVAMISETRRIRQYESMKAGGLWNWKDQNGNHHVLLANPGEDMPLDNLAGADLNQISKVLKPMGYKCETSKNNNKRLWIK